MQPECLPLLHFLFRKCEFAIQTIQLALGTPLPSRGDLVQILVVVEAFGLIVSSFASHCCYFMPQYILINLAIESQDPLVAVFSSDIVVSQELLLLYFRLLELR